MPSVHHHPDLIRNYLASKCALGRVVGPLPTEQFWQVHTSRFGLIPKMFPGEWRLIVDHSSPEGASVNDGVSEHLCSLRYVTVEDAIQEIGRLGRGAQLAKVDTRKAYRNVPVHSHDRPLLGMVWDGMLFVDTTLPFGLRSAPKIFNTLADEVEWIAQQRGVQCILHHLHDFLVMGSPDTYF